MDIDCSVHSSIMLCMATILSINSGYAHTSGTLATSVCGRTVSANILHRRSLFDIERYHCLSKHIDVFPCNSVILMYTAGKYLYVTPAYGDPGTLVSH